MLKTYGKFQAEARANKLRDYQILNGGQEKQFDQVTNMAARLLQTPIAMICLLDRDRQWIKSAFGIDLKQISHEIPFCAYNIEDEHVMFIEDASSDHRFRDNPLVSGAHAMKSYAGAPLRSKDGFNLGCLCVIDTEPRTFLREHERTLADLASIIVEHMETRLLANRAIKAEQRLVDAVDALPDGFVFYDENDRLLLCNQRYKEIYSESADLIVPGARFEDIIRGGVDRGQYPEAAGQENDWVRERVRIHQNPGDPIEQELPGDRWLRIQEGKTSDGGRIGFRFDITQLKRQERELTRLAWTDGLTNTMNRTRFMDLSENELSQSKRHQRSLGLLVMDIDHFKKINDRFGHAAGDQVLIDISRRWKSVLRQNDLLARLGGEEFGVLLPMTDVNRAVRVAEMLRLITQVQPISHNEERIDVTVSIGIGLGRNNEHYQTIDDMMLAADKALYDVKRSGRNGVQLLAA